MILSRHWFGYHPNNFAIRYYLYGFFFDSRGYAFNSYLAFRFFGFFDLKFWSCNPLPKAQSYESSHICLLYSWNLVWPIFSSVLEILLAAFLFYVNLAADVRTWLEPLQALDWGSWRSFLLTNSAHIPCSTFLRLSKKQKTMDISKKILTQQITLWNLLFFDKFFTKRC